jgi:hypothetical protein
MSLQNRVTPFGTVVFAHARGTLMGNRGCLHNDRRELTGRQWTTQSWVTCLLSFGGRRRELMRPGYYTELFFLDEATALAAGHRPCAECRRTAFRNFIRCWVATSGATQGAKVAELDKAIHVERVDRWRGKITYTAPFSALPSGILFALEDRAMLKWNGVARPWSLTGYGQSIEHPQNIEVVVLTPRPIVEIIRAGYRLDVHPSVDV